MIEPEFWKNKRVFITGHTGFKGSWLSIWLEMMGAKVTGYSLAPPSTPSLFELSGIGNKIRDIRGDIRDKEMLDNELRQAEPDIVFHLAAQTLVLQSYETPVETYDTNVLGTVKLLDSLRTLSSVRACVIITTDKCYENREWVWGYREDDPMGGYDPYSSSKGCCELAISSFRRSFFNSQDYGKIHNLAIASARAGNVIGGGDWADNRLVPDMIKAFSENKPVLIRSPHAIRPWQYVLEPLSGYLVLAEKLFGYDGIQFAEGWNFGPEDKDAKCVEWIVEKITTLWGPEAEVVIENREHLHEANYLKLDISKARSKLGWNPKLTLDNALAFLVNWYKRYNDEKVIDICREQIRSYLHV